MQCSILKSFAINTVTSKNFSIRLITHCNITIIGALKWDWRKKKPGIGNKRENGARFR